MSALLELRGLVAGYGDAPVVHGLDLRVDAGEVVALLGPNGAGKTATLLTVSGLLRPLGGSLTLFGERLGPPRGPRSAVGRRARAGLAHVSDDRSLFPGLTVAEHLTLAAPRSSRRTVLDATWERFGELEALRDRRAGVLSGGEQQLLAVARAIAAGPRLLMVDELSLGLAPRIVARVLPVLRQLAAEGAGVLVVEQQVGAALEVADRAVVLAGGRVARAGTATELAADRSVLAEDYLGPGPRTAP